MSDLLLRGTWFIPSSYVITPASSVEDEEGTSNCLFLADAEQLEDVVILPVRRHDQYKKRALLL